jgi:light-regulated signal transduction histidine kinase (bacteriophytochrome)
LSAQSKAMQEEDQFVFYMDLLGHDVLNNNQAVLSYLELILATPGVDKKVKDFAEKAVSHVRTSTVLVDNVKKLMASKGIEPETLKPIDIVKSIERAESELRRHFPGKKIRLEIVALPKSAFVLGDNYAADLVLNVFITAVRLNPGDDIVLSATLVEEKYRGKPAWAMRVEDRNSQLPPFLDGEGVAATYSQDISTAVKTTGVLFAKMIAGNLGGDFEAHSLHHDPKKKGAIFTVIFGKVEKP